MNPLDAVVFGEAMVMFIADEYGPLEEVERYTRALAGAEVNVAVGLARLGYHVGWISRVGDDPFGRYVANTLAAAGVDTSRVLVDAAHPTGFQLKSRVQSGNPEVVYFRRGSAASHLEMAQGDSAYIRSARHLHVTGIPPALSTTCRAFTYAAIEQARAAGMTVSFDPNLRPTLWKSVDDMRAVLNDLAAHADWVLPGLDEGYVLTGYSSPGDIAQFYLDRGVTLVAVKAGPQGASLFTRDAHLDMPAMPVDVVDTVGAGDGFAVGLISGRLDGLDLPGSLERANAIGALAVTSRGDMDGLPDRETLRAFLRRSSSWTVTSSPVSGA